MINPKLESESTTDQSNIPLSAAALEFANILGGALAQQWIQEQVDANHSARSAESDVSSGKEVSLTRIESTELCLKMVGNSRHSDSDPRDTTASVIPRMGFAHS